MKLIVNESKATGAETTELYRDGLGVEGAPEPAAGQLAVIADLQRRLNLHRGAAEARHRELVGETKSRPLDDADRARLGAGLPAVSREEA